MLVTHLAQRIKQLVATRIPTPSRTKQVGALATKANNIGSTHRMIAPSVLRKHPGNAANRRISVRPNVTPSSAQFLSELNATLARRRQAVAQIAAPVSARVNARVTAPVSAPAPMSAAVGQVGRPASKSSVVPIRKTTPGAACTRPVKLRPAPPPPVVVGVVGLTSDSKLWPAANLHAFASELRNINRRKQSPSGDQLLLRLNLVSSSKDQPQRMR